MAPRRIGIDTGGTFTDIATIERGRIVVHKVPSTPDDPGRAVLDGIAAVRRSNAKLEVDVVHGTTVGINAILTGDLARTAFVTNAGFEDLIEIGRQERIDLYDLEARKAVVPVPRRLRFGIPSRRGADGERTAMPSAAQLRELRARLLKSRCEAIAIGLLHSYAHPEDEHEVAQALGSLGLPITCSADLLRASGEFERFTACILNAAVRPVVSGYLDRLHAPVRPGTLRLMRSSGGILVQSEATEFPARAMFSGPAGGVLATRALARRAGYADVAALDMGGTSTDVCLVQPRTVVSDSTIAGLPLAIPSVEVHTVGCGGGSLARADRGGALQIGPESAGAAPGPACYGVGEEPTVTDAHVALGHMGARTLLRGDFPVDPDRSVRAIERLGKRLALSARATAAGILQVADIHMVRALMVITVQRAVDPTRVPLVAYGGAGGLHAAALRRLLEMPAAIVPENPGAFSAVGLALAGESAEHSIPVLRRLADLTPARIDRIAQTAARVVRKAVPDRARIRFTAGLRYAGQGAALFVPLRHPLERTLQREHERRFGFVPEHRDVELVAIRIRGETRARSLPERRATTARATGPSATQQRRPPVGGSSWPVHRREELVVGTSLTGPCLIEELTGTVVVPEGDKCFIRPFGIELRTAE